jgi:hypothetical protein
VPLSLFRHLPFSHCSHGPAQLPQPPGSEGGFWQRLPLHPLRQTQLPPAPQLPLTPQSTPLQGSAGMQTPLPSQLPPGHFDPGAAVTQSPVSRLQLRQGPVQPAGHMGLGRQLPF